MQLTTLHRMVRALMTHDPAALSPREDLSACEREAWDAVARQVEYAGGEPVRVLPAAGTDVWITPPAAESAS